MTTTRTSPSLRNYTLPPDAVEAAQKIVEEAMYSVGYWGTDDDHVKQFTTAAITAFIDHMVASGDAECTQHSMSRLALLIVLDGTKEPTT